MRERASTASARSTPAEAQADAADADPARHRRRRRQPGDAWPARMPEQDRALELFLLLNGLERNAALTPGQRYKIVAE